MPDPATFVLTAILAVIGATVSGMAGFGFSIISMPFLLLMYPPKTAVPLTLVIVGIGVVFQWVNVRRHADYRLAGRLLAGALAGVPLGGLILVAIGQAQLKVVIGLAVVVTLLVHTLLKRKSGAPSQSPGWRLSVGTGFVSGVLSTTVGQPGIPIALMMSWTGLDKAVLRGTMVTVLMITQLVSVGDLFLRRILTPEILWTGLGLVPFYVIGIALGNLAFRYSSQGVHRRVVTGVLTVSGLTGLANGLIAMLS